MGRRRPQVWNKTLHRDRTASGENETTGRAISYSKIFGASCAGISSADGCGRCTSSEWIVYARRNLREGAGISQNRSNTISTWPQEGTPGGVVGRAGADPVAKLCVFESASDQDRVRWWGAVIWLIAQGYMRVAHICERVANVCKAGKYPITNANWTAARMILIGECCGMRTPAAKTFPSPQVTLSVSIIMPL
jgi:hypothetical protein